MIMDLNSHKFDKNYSFVMSLMQDQNMIYVKSSENYCENSINSDS